MLDWSLIATLFSTPIVFCLTVAALLLQLIIMLLLFGQSRRAHQERARVHQELFGIMKKIEGLSAGKRAMILYQMDSLLERLMKQLPTRISTQAGEVIYETESQMLRTLAELEPGILAAPAGKARIEKLVVSMEKLETTIVALTSECVQQAIIDAKKSLIEGDSLFEKA